MNGICFHCRNDGGFQIIFSNNLHIGKSILESILPQILHGPFVNTLPHICTKENHSMT